MAIPFLSQIPLFVGIVPSIRNVEASFGFDRTISCASMFRKDGSPKLFEWTNPKPLGTLLRIDFCFFCSDNLLTEAKNKANLPMVAK